MQARHVLYQVRQPRKPTAASGCTSRISPAARLKVWTQIVGVYGDDAAADGRKDIVHQFFHPGDFRQDLFGAHIHASIGDGDSGVLANAIIRFSSRSVKMPATRRLST